MTIEEKQFTVSGVFTDSWQRVSHHVTAPNSHEAEVKVLQLVDSESFVLAGVYEGFLQDVSHG